MISNRDFFRLASFLILGLGSSPAKGIAVRFLSSPPQDSIVRYEIFRVSAMENTPRSLGRMDAVPGKDTLSFADPEAAKGSLYAYYIQGIDREGFASEPSERTLIAFPRISFPDTMRPDPQTGLTLAAVSALSDPMRGIETMAMDLADSSRFLMAFDTVSHTAAFRSRSGQADSGWVVARARYLGKFEDLDSVFVSVADAAPGSIAVSPFEAQRPAHARTPPGWTTPRWQGRDAIGRRQARPFP